MFIYERSQVSIPQSGLTINGTLSALLREADTHLAPHRFAEGPSGLLCKAKASVVANIARSQWPP